MRFGSWMRGVVLGIVGIMAVAGASRAGAAPEAEAGAAAEARPAVDASQAVPTREAEVARAADHGLWQGVPHLAVILGALLLFLLGCALYYDRQNVRLHNTLRLMVESGAPIPAELLRPVWENESADRSGPAAAGDSPRAWMRSNQFWSGVLWVGVGVGALLYFWMRENAFWALGVVPLLFGIGMLGMARNGVGPVHRPADLLWGGLLWAGLGAGVLFYFWLRGSPLWPLGLIPLLYGLGAIVVARIARPRNS